MVTSKQAHTLTHFRNAVPLVWGSLRLAPIILHEKYNRLDSVFVCLDERDWG